MSSTTFGHKGVEAVQNKDYAAAIPLLDKALASSNSPPWLLARAQAHQQLKNYDAALRDVELAYHTAAERGSGTSRKHMIEAQYRRSVLYFKQKRYADADCCAKWSMLLAEGRPAREDDEVDKKVDKDGNYTVTYAEGVADCKTQPGQSSGFKMGLLDGLAGGTLGGGTPKTGFESDWNRAYAWRSQVLGVLNGLPEDHPGRKITVTKIPAKPQKESEAAPAAKPAPKPVVVATETKAVEAKPPPAPGSVPDDQLKLRVDFYQSAQAVTISLFAKDAKKDDLNVVFSTNEVSSLSTHHHPPLLTPPRSKSPPFRARPPHTSSRATAKLPPPSTSAAKSTRPSPAGRPRPARSNSSSTRPPPATNGASGAPKKSAAPPPPRPQPPRQPPPRPPSPPRPPQPPPARPPTQPAPAPAPRTGTH